jgi:hypothetical protein
MDDDEIISRSEAKARGLKTYFTGKPCKHGHVAIRQTSNGSCRECSDAKDRRWRQQNQEYVRKRNRSYHADHYARNREKIIEKSHQYYEANKPMALHRMREYYILCLRVRSPSPSLLRSVYGSLRALLQS